MLCLKEIRATRKIAKIGKFLGETHIKFFMFLTCFRLVQLLSVGRKTLQ